MPFVLAVVFGALLALCGLPLPWSELTPIPLAALLWLISLAPTPRRAAGLAFVAGLVYFGVQLAWLPQSFGAGFGIFGYLMFLPVFAIEGAFWAILAALVVWLVRTPGARLWALAGGWTVLDWLRTLGPLAFPWSAFGYTLEPIPLVQTADLWGVLGLGLIVTASAAALARLMEGQWRPAVVMALVWLGGSAYGLTRTPGGGEQGRMLLLRTQVNSFDKFNGLTFLGTNLALSRQAQPGEVVAWSETAIQSEVLSNPAEAKTLPTALITGVGYPGANAAVSWDGRVESRYDKVKLVPFGEYFPFSGPLAPMYDWIFTRLGFGNFDFPVAGTRSVPLSLDGVLYGTYICYDDVFSALAREQVRNGAELLLNVSNDGWFKGWGISQHFMMNRLRAIETRRWSLRSVNDGVTAVVDDLGRPQSTLTGGEGVLHARYLRLHGQTIYVRLGDWSALGVSLLLLLGALIADARAGRRRRLL